MALWKKIICTLGHTHEVFSVGDIILPYKCHLEKISGSTLQNKKGVVEFQSNKLTNAPTEKIMKTVIHTNDFHNDPRETVVLIQGKVYELKLSTTWTIDSLAHTNPDSRPHVRSLNAIPLRSKSEQAKKNQDDGYVHDLMKDVTAPETPLKSSKKNIKQGSTIPKEIQKLLDQKEVAEDKKEIKRINRALRKLDYRRYTSTNNQEE